jgi:pimeloyl-ACP methyl ester carboxylesterase
VGDAEYALADQATLIHRFILRLGLTNLTIVGNSFGGGVALLTALSLEDEEPDRLRALVLIDSVAYPQRLPTFMKLLRTPVLGRLGLALLPSQFLARHVLELAYHDDSEITQATVEAYAEPLKTYDGRHAVLETAKRIIPPDLEELTARYATLEVPTLLVWGRQDELVPLWVGRRLHRALPNSRLVVVEDSGHLPHEEKPAEVAGAMLSFFKQTQEDRSSAAEASLGSSSRAPRTRLHDSAAGTSAPDHTSRRSATRCNRHLAEAALGA